ncbi:hypothetical protein SAMN04487787_11472 [Kosakonia sacchari]|nr:hypothetical protein SAMN04487787_11472 [Kosakonia sacchari]
MNEHESYYHFSIQRNKNQQILDFTHSILMWC